MVVYVHLQYDIFGRDDRRRMDDVEALSEEDKFVHRIQDEPVHAECRNMELCKSKLRQAMVENRMDHADTDSAGTDTAVRRHGCGDKRDGTGDLYSRMHDPDRIDLSD